MRAEEFRAKADNCEHQSVRETLRKVAKTYDDLVKRAEQILSKTRAEQGPPPLWNISHTPPFSHMPRYFFNVHNVELSTDEQGEHFPDNEAAWREATSFAGALFKDIDGKFRPGQVAPRELFFGPGYRCRS